MTMIASMMSSSAMRANATFPAYTLPDFAILGETSFDLSGAVDMIYAPLVRNADRATWESYSVSNQDMVAKDVGSDQEIPGFMHTSSKGPVTPVPEADFYAPIWQMNPLPTKTSVFNFNLLGVPEILTVAPFVGPDLTVGTTGILDTEFLLRSQDEPMSEHDGHGDHRKLNENIFGDHDDHGDHGNHDENSHVHDHMGHPQSLLIVPVYEEAHNEESPIVGYIVAVMSWYKVFQDILKDSSAPMYAVLEESCGHTYTYCFGHHGEGLEEREGDHHLQKYDHLKQSNKFIQYPEDVPFFENFCEYNLSLYPDQSFEDQFKSKRPLHSSLAVAGVFLWIASVFFFYDFLVRRRQDKVNDVATKSNAVVASLFPAQVRDKLMMNQMESSDRNIPASTTSLIASRFTSDSWANTMNQTSKPQSAPIADLFPSATVLFMDIEGFTAWSSQREPSQVFVLLETIYRAFDKIAQRRKVFKVETIGDCYVAVCGLPEPCKDHAIVMARFARDCMDKMNTLARQLEASLGPDTALLAMRAGLHSGPVTAGVLRGERARFQLFGDTVNTAARMESTGIKRKIQMTKETAELIAAKHRNWIRPRQDIVVAKGKGEMQTYWLLSTSERTKSETSLTSDEYSDDSDFQDAFAWLKVPEQNVDSLDESARSIKKATEKLDGRIERMVDYVSDLMLQCLTKIIATRGRNPTAGPGEDRRLAALEEDIGKVGIPLEEVEEVIELPSFDQAAYVTKGEQVKPEVVEQLQTFVALVAKMYHRNPFHNFEHASHVTQSTTKLLSRIVATTHMEEAENLHDSTYGITSDPLTHFAVVFAALIHDVDHRGVPNFLVTKEEPEMGEIYRKQAVAEQNSIDVAWNLLMEPNFIDLRRAIYTTESELKRFRALVVNCVMATDIFDKELSSLRKDRWERAFSSDCQQVQSQVSINRKATIVIEHIVQASDVAHTMQHWHVYSKWNERLYAEMFMAYCEGRSNKDPTDSWYEGELWFFDNYVIPLANKLEECGVFGVSSDEYLNYALANRREWEKKGKAIVQSNFQKYKGMLGYNSSRSLKLEPDLMPLPRHE